MKYTNNIHLYNLYFYRRYFRPKLHISSSNMTFSSDNTNFKLLNQTYLPLPSYNITNSYNDFTKNDINVDEFLEILHHDYYKRFTILKPLFNDQYENIIQYIDLPNKFDTNNYDKCVIFFNRYSNYLINNYNKDARYYYLCNAITIVVEHFGGFSEYDKIVKYYGEKIHHKYIGKGLAKIHKIYPTFFPKFKKATTCFFRSCMSIRFSKDYILSYSNKCWSLDHSNTSVLVNNKSIEDVIEYMKLIF